jgi:excinuclease ABC subunit A
MDILIRGARQHNLKDLRLRLPLNELLVVTGVSGSGKSSLAFDTLFAEGQRRYVETFSPYARQFLDRMDKPRVDHIDGIPPAIAIDQTNPVRTSRSTVGTMTEINDHLKLLFARAARLYCRNCGQPVQRDSAQTIGKRLLSGVADSAQRDPVLAAANSNATPTVLISFKVPVPQQFTEEEVEGFLMRQGYTRFLSRGTSAVEVIQDRVRLQPRYRERLVESLESALKRGEGTLSVYRLDDDGKPCGPKRFSTELHCADCDLPYREPLPSLFSFNSPIGACETCRGFGRTIGIDYARVIPDPGLSLAQGAIKPWQSDSYYESQADLLRFARRRDVPTNVAWQALTDAQQRWVLEGEGSWQEGAWYGVKRFFEWLETKSYKMHIRVLLSKYRSYTTCERCHGARLKTEALNWRLGTAADAKRARADTQSDPKAFFAPSPKTQGLTSPGLAIHEVMALSIDRCHRFFQRLYHRKSLDEASALLVDEIRSRLRYLCQVGLGYLTLDRQSRTLSGGEVQRINLTTALGTSLVNTLFVLDEPSIGLHARDIKRIIGVLHDLRDRGNSLVVVEHDPEIMHAADRLLDLGPGAGERGGRVTFFGKPAELAGAKGSLTAQYLTGEKSVAKVRDWVPRPPLPSTPHLEILGADEHNLKNIDVRVPLNRLVCITGVSGSGKSTLISGICYPALRRLLGHPAEVPGRFRELRGAEHLKAVVLVDQAPIGKTSRSNPASYIGAFDAIRKLFAREPLARERGYTAGTFSFNTGQGRCPTCRGNGFEHVEMQFLSDVYLRCPDCDGRRFRPEVLEVKLLPSSPAMNEPRRNTRQIRAVAANPSTHQPTPQSIAEVLAMTVAEALGFFGGENEVVQALRPLESVGLQYLRLGQPVPTLSGGEAQRLKLAGQLSKARTSSSSQSTLFLLDEPTTGLHFEDIRTLLGAFQALIEAGHSVVVIEHNLDVIRSADWVIDLGPEGGEEGGAVMCQGTPESVAACNTSHTGKALRLHLGGEQGLPAKNAATPAPPAESDQNIRVHHAREHNLKNVDVRIPRDGLTVITGVSGSGKSTLAFDILFAEGQRRYLESLNAYVRQFVQPAARPDVDAIFGIPPTVAIEQRTSRGGYRSTVATLTEIHDFLRLLFAKLGTPFCPECGCRIETQSPEAIAASIQRRYAGRQITLLTPLVAGRKGYYTELADWAKSKGFASLRVDGKWLPTAAWPKLDRFKAHDIELPVGDLEVSVDSERRLRALLCRALDFGNGMVRVSSPPQEPPTASSAGVAMAEGFYSTKRACPQCGRSFPAPDPRLFSFNSAQGWCPACDGSGIAAGDIDGKHQPEPSVRRELLGQDEVCNACRGKRLRPESIAVRFHERSIAAITALSVDAAERFFHHLELDQRERQIARDLLSELRPRLAFLRAVGLGYLTLDRAAPTLSGGEAQRIRLAAQLGSNLRGVCYVLDEPSIGLHVRDNRRLLSTLRQLTEKGNTVVVVEHDPETIRQADHVIDLGPGAGAEGGHIVAEGALKAILANPRSITGRFIRQPMRHPLRATRRRTCTEGATEPALVIRGARLHNLKNIHGRFPLQRMICVTGVSGSGKSTLVREILCRNLRRLLREQAIYRRGSTPAKLLGCQKITGWQRIGRLLEVDQTPIGKTPRSCPATYVGIFDAIRRLFAETPEARIRGYSPGRFSFNVDGGRCPACEGQGVKKIAMNFLPDVRVVCDVCAGTRFTPETLAVCYKGKHIAEVLAMSVDEASAFFSAHSALRHTLSLLQYVGLGYLRLGQESPSLSGGEAQRIKLVAELAKSRSAETPSAPMDRSPQKNRPSRTRTLYLLDEPTIGLHMADVEKLIRVLHRLVDNGNTAIIIEHNLDIIAEADWVIDLGPEGGQDGGCIVAEGAPESLARLSKASHTAKALASFLGATATP